MKEAGSHWYSNPLAAYILCCTTPRDVQAPYEQRGGFPFIYSTKIDITIQAHPLETPTSNPFQQPCSERWNRNKVVVKLSPNGVSYYIDNRKVSAHRVKSAIKFPTAILKVPEVYAHWLLWTTRPVVFLSVARLTATVINSHHSTLYGRYAVLNAAVRTDRSSSRSRTHNPFTHTHTPRPRPTRLESNRKVHQMKTSHFLLFSK
jgi:hypothetical protein